MFTNELELSHLNTLRELEKGDTTSPRFEIAIPWDDQKESLIMMEVFEPGIAPDIIALRNFMKELCMSMPQGDGVISHGDKAEAVTPAMMVSGWYPKVA